MFNATLIGRLTRDPEAKATTTGNTYARFSIAINNGKDKAGADKPATFVECSVFGKTGEFVMSYARKGARVCVSANMEVGTYANKNTGETMLSVNAIVDAIELIDWPDKDQAAPVQPQGQPPMQQAYPPMQQGYGAPPAYQPQGQYGAPPQQGQIPQGQPPMQQAYPPQPQYQTQQPPIQQQGYPQQQQLPVQQGYQAQGQPTAAAPWLNSPLG